MVAIAMMAIVGCAGMPKQDQENMAANAGIWGAIGAAGSAGIAAATGHAAGPAAVIGGVAGALLGASNTPKSEEYACQCSRSDHSRCISPISPAYRQAYEEAYLREQERQIRQRQRWEEERARRRGKLDAMWDDWCSDHRCWGR